MRGYRDLGRKATNWLTHFGGEKRGSTAIIFALSSLTLLSSVGVGIDLARAMMVKSRLAGALDAAALAVGTTNGMDAKQLQTLAQQYFDANYTKAGIGTTNPVAVTLNGQHISLSVDAAMPTTLLEIMGIHNIDLGVTNEVTRAMTKLRVALVLDNTGSMAQTDATGTSKISALKTATHQLLTQLKGAAANPGDVQVSIIPFSLDVNMGTAVANADWIDWRDFDHAPPNTLPGEPGEISKNVGPGSSCPFATNVSPYGYGCLYLSSGKIAADGKIYPGVDKGKYNPGRSGHHYNGYFDSVQQKDGTYTHTWRTYNHVAGADLPLHGAWTGCFMDRAQNYDTTNTTPAIATPDTQFPAEISDSCPPVALTGLGFDWAALDAKVNQMTPKGSTNQTIGLAWGWQALTSTNPLNAPAQDATVQNVIVLLSDGMNTQNRFGGDGSNQSAAVDARMALACANAKAANVRIYTVLVMAGNSSTLQSCASDTKKYFSLTTAGQIVTAFNSIGTELANLHLSR
jgi:Flp pilus assembly protein TadG